LKSEICGLRGSGKQTVAIEYAGEEVDKGKQDPKG